MFCTRVENWINDRVEQGKGLGLEFGGGGSGSGKVEWSRAIDMKAIMTLMLLGLLDPSPVIVSRQAVRMWPLGARYHGQFKNNVQHGKVMSY